MGSLVRALWWIAGNPVVCNGRDTSANTLTFLHFVEFIMQFWLKMGKLVPHDSICEVYYCDMCTSSFSKMYVYARCVVQCHRAHYTIKGMDVWSWQGHFLHLGIHNTHTHTHTQHMYNRALHTYINIWTYMHPHWQLLHPLCYALAMGLVLPTEHQKY
jgi:hypothetical protein